MINDQEGEKKSLNKNEPHINRGFELLLRKRRREPLKSKVFKVAFGKMISLFRREFHLYIEVSLDVKKKLSREN